MRDKIHAFKLMFVRFLENDFSACACTLQNALAEENAVGEQQG